MQDSTEPTKTEETLEQVKPSETDSTPKKGEEAPSRSKPRRKYTLSAKVCEEYKYTWADVFTGEPPLELPDEIVQMNVKKVISLLAQVQEILGYEIVITKFLGGEPQGSEVDEMFSRGMAVEFICPPYDPFKIFTRLSNHSGGLAVINGRVYLDIGDKRRWKFP